MRRGTVPYGNDGRAMISALKVTGPELHADVGSRHGQQRRQARLRDHAHRRGRGLRAERRQPARRCTHHLTASYSGDPTYLGFARAVPPFTIGKASTRTVMTLSTARISYGHETAEQLSVKLTTQFGTTPTGRVTIKTGKTTLCAIALKAGIGHCTLTAKQLKAGTYTLTADYAGSVDYHLSTSAARPLTVTK